MYIPPSPLCPVERLPTPFFEAVVHGCQRTEAPPEVVVPDVLALVSTLTQRLYKVKGIHGSLMPTTLNTLSLAPTVTGKGESYKMFFQAPADFEADVPKQPANVMTIDDLLLQDVSTSVLMAYLAGYGKSASIQLEDGYSFLHGPLMKPETISKLTQAWSGPPSLKFGRLNGSKDAHEPCLAIGLRIQPDLFYGFMKRDKRESRPLGLWSRFFVSCYDPQRFPVTPWYPAAASSMASYLPLMERLKTLQPTAEAPPESDQPVRKVLVMDTYANAHLREITHWVKGQMYDRFHDIQDAAGRAAENTLRMASNFHLVCNGDGPITRDMIERAWAFEEWSLAQYRNVFVRALQPPPEPVKLKVMKPPRLPAHQQRLNTDAQFVVHCIVVRSPHYPNGRVPFGEVALLSGWCKARFLKTLGWLVAGRLVDVEGGDENAIIRLLRQPHLSGPGDCVPSAWRSI